MTTVSCTKDAIPKLCRMKVDDAEQEVKKCETLKNLVIFENEITDEEREMAQKAGLTLHTMESVIFAGREAFKNGTVQMNEPTPDMCSAFSYTSGTTGDPKGVKLTHKMLVLAAAAVNVRCEPHELTEKDCYISYLPAAHSFEQCLFAFSCNTGCKIGFFGGNVLKLTEDMGVLKPTLFPSVPRLYNKIYGKI